MSVEDVILEDIEVLNEQLKGMKPGSDEYEATANMLSKLMDKAIEMGKINLEAEQKAQQMDDEKKDRWVKNGIGIGTALLTAGVTIWGTLKTFEFEKEGTVTSIIGRLHIGNLLRKK